VTDTLTALPQPRFPDPRDAPSLRWGILAPGAIANDFVHSLRAHTGQRVVAVGSRNADRAAAFADRHEVGRSYGSYEELVADSEVDVVYIASPHSEHTANALLAIGAGKHVLIEKPMAATAAEAQEIVDAARAAGVFAMEAMWTRYLPQLDIARQLLEAGSLGEVRVVTADFGGAAEFDPKSRLFDPRLAGGALLDIGVYTVSFASFAMGGAPTSVIASGELAPSGVDAQAALILTGPTGAQALLSTGLHARTPWTASIAGTLGRLDIDSPFWSASGVRVHDTQGHLIGTWRDESGRPDRQGMCYQAAALARYVTAGLTESPLHSLDETVSIITTIDEARRQLGYVRLGHAAE
jgi:predicted dehydrogenase